MTARAWRALADPGTSRWRRLVNVLAWLALAVSTVLYVNHVQKQTERKFCAVINASLPAPGGPPPTSDRVRRGLAAMTQLKHDLGC